LTLQVFILYNELTYNFKALFQCIENKNKSLRTTLPPKQCYLTTMTFIATLSRQDVVVGPKMVMDLGGYEDDYFTCIKQSAFSSSCIEFHSQLAPSVRVKLFNKGSLQITGCKTHLSALQSILEVCRVLSTYLKTTVDVVTMGIALMNINVETQTGINLTRFAQAARAREIIAEQPERPPSCILKLPTTVLVYKPGKFTICAGSPEDAFVAYATAMEILDESPGVAESKTVDALRRGKGKYTWTQLVQCGMPGLLHTHAVTTNPLEPGCIRCALDGNWFARAPHQT